MFPVFQPHLDVIFVVAFMAIGYWYLDRHTRTLLAADSPAATRLQRLAWYAGVTTLFVSAWWPLHDLAEQTLFTAHMLEHLLIGYVVPPLLLVGTPRWLADMTLGRAAPVLRHVATPVVGFFAFNIAIVAIHWPLAIAWQSASAGLHVLAHVLMFLAGMAMWMPIFSPTPVLPRMSHPMQMMYLFLMTIVPTVPASFLTFSREPLFPTYGDAGLAWGLTAVADQTIGGILMKLGGGLYLLGVIVWLWVRWTRQEREWDRIERQLANTP